MCAPSAITEYYSKTILNQNQHQSVLEFAFLFVESQSNASLIGTQIESDIKTASNQILVHRYLAKNKPN